MSETRDDITREVRSLCDAMDRGLDRLGSFEFKLILPMGLALWPVLWLGAEWEWWSSLLTAIGILIVVYTITIGIATSRAISTGRALLRRYPATSEEVSHAIRALLEGERFQLDRDIYKQLRRAVLSAQVPENGALSAVVKSALKALGACPVPANQQRVITDSQGQEVSIPEPLRVFIQEFEWPDDIAYETPDGRFWGVDFVTQPPAIVDELPNTEGRNLVLLGITDGGNWMLCVSLDDENPADPTLYHVDHADEFSETEDRLGKLSDFLVSLHPHFIEK